MQTTAEWAIWGKMPGDMRDYRMLACSMGMLTRWGSDAQPREWLRGFPYGPEEPCYLFEIEPGFLRQVIICQERAPYSDGCGRRILKTTCLILPFDALAQTGCGFSQMAELFEQADVKAYLDKCSTGAREGGFDFPPLKIELPDRSTSLAQLLQVVDKAGYAFCEQAASTLLRKKLLIFKAESRDLSYQQQLQWLDAVLALFPYGLRADCTVRIWENNLYMYCGRGAQSGQTLQPDVIIRESQPSKFIMPRDWAKGSAYLLGLPHLSEKAALDTILGDLLARGEPQTLADLLVLSHFPLPYRDFHHLLQLAEFATAEKNLDDANNLLGQAHELLVASNNLSEKRLIAQVSEQLARAFIAGGNLAEARRALVRSLSLAPDDLAAQELLEWIEEQRKLLCLQAEHAMQEEKFIEAAHFLQQSMAISPDDEHTQQLKRVIGEHLFDNLERLEREMAQSAIQHKDIQQSLQAELDALKQAQKKRPPIYASLAHPKVLSKRFVSSFLVYIHPKNFSPLVERKINHELAQIKKERGQYQTSRHATNVELDTKVTVSIHCPGLEFSAPVTVIVSESPSQVVFVVKPQDTCEVGKHLAKLAIVEHGTDVELFELVFEIRVVDFVIDHISRPLVLKGVAFLSGLGGLVMYLLTFFGKVDSTFGLTSGTAIGAFGLAVYWQFIHWFQRAQSPGIP